MAMAMTETKLESGASSADAECIKQVPPILSRIGFATTISALQSVGASGRWYKGWTDWFSPPEKKPSIVKKYDVRPYLPIRIFFPANYDQTSPQTLPTLFTIHAGGFCIGASEDDDQWNGTFADLHNVLVISLNYSKAPWSPYPAGLNDVVALYLAAVEDESLPIDRSRIAMCGFSAGGNLGLAACQLPSIKNHPTAAPKAMVPIYPPVDFSVEPHTKFERRPYKKGLPGIRGEMKDWVIGMAAAFDWAYTPFGTNLRDPLVSPLFAKREDLPKYVFVIAAELDYLAYEGHQLATRLAGKGDLAESMIGRPEKAVTQELELDDKRFAWESPETGVRWLLVPDVIHAFDMHYGNVVAADPPSVREAEAKTVKYMKVMGEWLFNKGVW